MNNKVVINFNMKYYNVFGIVVYDNDFLCEGIKYVK